MKPFAELGALIESRWRDQNYNEEVFPEIATRGLSEARLCELVDPWEIVRWVHQTPNLPEQMDPDGRFGNPPITLFAGSRFNIDVYYWLDGTTTIHQHSFSGAFQVLLGGSVHSKYHFEKTLEINPHFLTGKISLEEVSLLNRGEIREIRPGPQFIHSLFHLERPSATITVRTLKDPRTAVQYSYRRPFFAINPFFKDPVLAKRTQTVSLLLRTKHPDADRFIGDLIDSSDFHTCYHVLEQAYEFLCHRELEEIVGISRSKDRFKSLLDRAHRRHGDLADLLLPVLKESWRQDEISRRRAEIKGEAHRFFLALLLNVPERSSVLRLVQAKFPDQNPVDLIVRWVKELSATKTFGSKEPNVIGVEKMDDQDLFIFAGLLEGLSIDQIKAGAAAEPRLRSNGDLSIEESANCFRTLPLFSSILGPLSITEESNQ
jgi:hypothetical protein